MKFRKGLFCFLLVLLSVVVCANAFFADVAENETELYATASCDVGGIESESGRLLESDDSVENEALCPMKKNSRGKKFAKGENSIFAGFLRLLDFGRSNSANEMNSPLSVYVCTGESRRE